MTAIAIPRPPAINWPGILAGGLIGLLGLWLMFTLKAGNLFQIDVSSGSGNTYYLNCVTGNDSNSGLSEALAWLSLEHTSNVVVGGDTVLIQNGVCSRLTSGGVGQVMSLNRSGSAGNFITYKNFPGHSPQIGTTPPTLNESYGIFLHGGASFIRFEGLTFAGSNFACIFAQNVASNAGGNIEIVNNTFTQCGKAWTDCTPSGGHDAIFMGAWMDGSLIENNTFLDTGRVPDLSCNSLPQSQNHNWRHDHVIYVKGINHIIRNNLFLRYCCGYGIKIDGYSTSLGEVLAPNFTHVIDNNTFGPNTSQQPYDGRSGNPVHTFNSSPASFDGSYLFANNICLEPSLPASPNKGCILTHSGLGGSLFDTTHNECRNNISTGTITDEICSETNVNVAPMYSTGAVVNNTLNRTLAEMDFVDEPNDDYHLGATSIAINFGSSTLLSVPDFDIENLPRDFAGNNVDDGAYERQ